MHYKNYLGNNMSLNQLMKITGSVSLVTLLAFSQRGVLQAEEVVVPTTNRVNLEPININYNDTKAIANVSKTILKDQVNLLSELSLIEKENTKAVYALEDYVVTVYYDKESGLGVKDIKLTIETKFTNSRKEELKLVTSNDATKFVDGTVNEYNVKVKINDTVAPVIKLKKSSVTIKETDDFNIKNYIKSVSDNVDGKIDYSVSGGIKKSGKKNKPGTYTFKITAKDTSGNETSEKFTVKVKEEKYPTYTGGKSASTKNFKGTSTLVNAAYAQLGRKQDCTRLVSNSLAAAGINFHGWPREYFALGYTVSASQAKAGDLIYYANGGNGRAHIALYVGNGKAIHGGWGGNTVLYSANYGSCSTPIYIRIAK